MELYDRISSGKVYIIAEMSANHGGKIENALKIVEEAAKSGANCVKIQTYTADSLTINCHKLPYQIKDGLWDGMNYYDLYNKAMTPWEWQLDIKKKCEECGVDFLSTPFDKKSVDFLEGLGVEFYKIASYELVDIPLIEYIASKKKPIIMSVGMGTIEEIQEALDACKRMGNEQIVILKCCSQYPANYENMNLSVISDMQTRFNVPVGLSDHSFGALAPVIATSLGAKVIEKHVKIKGVESVDSDFSMTMDEFKDMVQQVRGTEIILGKATYERSEDEEKGTIGRRSLVASADIKVGEIFTEENIKSVRPAIGIAPKYYYDLIGKKAKNNYEFGDPIQLCEVK